MLPYNQMPILKQNKPLSPLSLLMFVLLFNSQLFPSSYTYILHNKHYESTPFTQLNTLSEFYPFYEDTNNSINTQLKYLDEIYVKGSDPRYDKIVTELAYMQVFAVATIGVIAVLPESVSQWSSEDKEFVDAQDLLKKHSQNVAKGPVWDTDTWQVNYIGHSVAGSYFYVWGRQSGLNWQEAAVLTTLMSTFYWEYGWEAFAEVPSIQDLIVTPVLGSLLGEYTNHLYNQVMDNDGKIYDSVILGGLGRALLNPIGEMNTYLDYAFDAANIEIAVDYAYNQNKDIYRLKQNIDQNGIVQSYFKFKFTLKY